jgi:peroxiredoxin
MAATPPVCEFGWNAVDFTLPATDGGVYSLADIMGENGTLLMFICNHCPYVTSVIDRLIADAHDIMGLGIGVAAISANDATHYPQDSFDNMASFAKANAFPFPYLYDAPQTTARAYGAACTPDFFGFNAEHELHYRGRLDAYGRATRPKGAARDLFDAMQQIADTGTGPATQVASMGCSIKWK